MGLIEFGDVGLAGAVKGRRGQNQDRGVDDQRQAQREGGIR